MVGIEELAAALNWGKDAESDIELDDEHATGHATSL